MSQSTSKGEKNHFSSNRDPRYCRPRVRYVSSDSDDLDEDKTQPMSISDKSPASDCTTLLNNIQTTSQIYDLDPETGASGTRDDTEHTTRTHVTLTAEQSVLNDDTFHHSDLSQPAHKSRMRWTRIKMINLLYAYFMATKIDTDRKNYTSRLKAIWNDEFDHEKLEGPRLSTQVRSILKRNVFSDIEIEQIKQNVRNTSKDCTDMINPCLPETTRIDVTDEKDENISIDQIKKNYDMYRNKYDQVLARNRPSIPKIPYNIKSKKIVEIVNENMEQEFQKSKSLIDTHSMIYCAALTVCTMLNIVINEKKSSHTVTWKKQEPPWKMRLENKIKSIRKNIGIIDQYYRCNFKVSEYVRNKVYDICYKAKIKYWTPNFLQVLREHLDFLKQKVASLGLRIKKYNKRTKRYHQNKLFRNNQKKFYRNLTNEKMLHNKNPPSNNTLYEFWEKLWGTEKSYNINAQWIKDEEQRMNLVPDMIQFKIDEHDIKNAVKYVHNWKSPGNEKIQNYWYKYFTSAHSIIAKQFQECIEDPTKMPLFFTEGSTYLLPKNVNIENPANYRPITCLPTVYKLFTSIIKTKIYKHVTQNNILAPEQVGCRNMSFGSKELLTIDSIISKQVTKNKRNVSVAWIDYLKAYDSIPHTWLIKVLEIYKVHPNIVKFLKATMKHWNTELIIKLPNKTILKTQKICFKTGIFQGDSLSGLWFCLALNPLSHILNQQSYGYKLNSSEKSKLTHLFYMDDLKLYSQNENQLHSQIEIVNKVSKDINMEFGTTKCKILNVKRGKIQLGGNVKLMDDTEIHSLEENETYKYLGIQQNLNINESDIKKHFSNMFIKRVKMIMNTELYAKYKVLAINTWAIPVIGYTFGIVNWSATDLKDLNRKVRTTMTKFRSHHPHSAVERIYLPRSKGGRGLIDIETY